MKKVLCLAIFAFGVLAFTSCSKDDDDGVKKPTECKCTVTATAAGIDPVVEKTTVVIKSGKCSDLNKTETTTAAGIKITTTVVCK